MIAAIVITLLKWVVILVAVLATIVLFVCCWPIILTVFIVGLVIVGFVSDVKGRMGK